MGWRQLAAGLLARRGSELGDPAERLRLAAICVRAAVETEERRDSAAAAPPPAAQGHDRVAGRADRTPADGTAPHADDLFVYAELLGEQADELAARDPLPGVTEIRQALRDVDTAEHATAAVRHRPGAARRRRVREDRGDRRDSSCTRATCPPTAR